MNLTVFLSAIITWALLLVVAILNAGLRTKILVRKLRELRAHQASSLIFMSLVLIASALYAALLSSTASLLDLWIVGLMWGILTMSFEFLFGHYVMKHSWQRLIEDYNLLKGRFWSLVVLTILIGPAFCGIMVGY